MYMFTVRQDVPGAGKRRLRAAAVEKDVDMADADVSVRARQIIGEVKRSYAALFLSRKAIDLHLTSVDLLRQFADVSSAKYATGRTPQQDVLKAIVEISKLHEDLLMLDEQAGVASAQLNALMDRAADAAIGPLVDPEERVLLPSVAELQQLALDQQPELRSAAIEVERAQATLAVARQDSKPDFSIAGGYMLLPRGGDAWTGSVGVTWPSAPWARGRLDAQRAEANAQIDAARARQRAAANRIRLAVQEAYVRLKAAEQRAALLRASVLPQTQHVLDASRIAYQTDRVDMLTIIDNQRQRLDAQVSYYRALSDLAQARADLEHAMGVDLSAAMLGPVLNREEASR
jgi:outer membrane protein TolC